jgi:hypothetical protein
MDREEAAGLVARCKTDADIQELMGALDDSGRVLITHWFTREQAEACLELNGRMPDNVWAALVECLGDHAYSSRGKILSSAYEEALMMTAEPEEGNPDK